MKIMDKPLQVLVAFLVLAGAAFPVPAQYPAKPVRLIVPFPSGGAAELTARIYAQALGQELGQPVVVETKPGGDGVIAADAVMKSTADGYTLFYATATGFSWVPSVRKNPPYDPLVDFTPVSLVGTFGFFLFTHPSVPAKSVAELLDHVRSNPGKLNNGTGTSVSTLMSAQLTLFEKLDIVNVPYKGDAPLTVDLLGGRVQMAFMTPGSALPHVKEGRLRALATLLSSRSPLLPEVPTAAEAGLARLSVTPWSGLFGPAKMPKEVVARIARETAIVLGRPDVREALDRVAFEARSSTPEELSAFVKQQLDVWRQAVREAGITQE